jgi:hypothetical protein
MPPFSIVKVLSSFQRILFEDYEPGCVDSAGRTSLRRRRAVMDETAHNALPSFRVRHNSPPFCWVIPDKLSWKNHLKRKDAKTQRRKERQEKTTSQPMFQFHHMG